MPLGDESNAAVDCACPMTEHRSANVPFTNGTCTRHGCKGCCSSDLSMPLGDESNAAADCACPMTENRSANVLFINGNGGMIIASQPSGGTR